MSKEIEVGDVAPNFELKSHNGKIISLKNFIGKKIILYFYPKDMTPGCTQEACDFRDNYEKLKNKDVIVLGISTDSIERHIKFAEKYNLPFPLLSDERKEVSKMYGVWKQKSMLGKKYMGIERSTFIIDEKGKVKSIFRKVKVKGHIEEVLQNI